jgi:hypothetical protein
METGPATRIKRRLWIRMGLLAVLVTGLTLASTRLQADTGTCGGVTTTVPFTDVMSSPFFCQIAEAFFSGLTNGTSATTYSPSANVTRDQMSAFITRTQDSSLKRGSKRAALQQFWTTTPRYPSASGGLGTTAVGSHPLLLQSDAEDLWVANSFSSTVSQVHASTGKLLNTWTGATNPFGVLAAMGRIFVAGETDPGSLYLIDPTGAPGPVTVVSSALGINPNGIAFDGSKIWVANNGTTFGTGSVSIVTPGMTTPWSVTTVTTGFSQLAGILFDGSNIWVTDTDAHTLLKLDGSGAILQTVAMGGIPQFPAFDGTNIWVPNQSGPVSVVRAATGTVIATLSGNGLNLPAQAAFDGQRILVTNQLGNSVSLWKAADLTPIGSFSTGTSTDPFGACSDGTYFWITLFSSSQLARF